MRLILITIFIIFISGKSFAIYWSQIDSPDIVTDNHFAGKLGIDRKFGDIAQFANNGFATAIIAYKNDKEGGMQYSKTLAVGLVAMGGIKELKLRERPDHSDRKSFPSGHATGAFLPAAFLYYRYGIEYASLPLLTAFLTSYSRVETKKHYITDTVAAAALSFATAKFFTTRDGNLSVAPTIGVNTKSLGMDLTYKF